MNPLTREAVEWLLNQPEICIVKAGAVLNASRCIVEVGEHRFADANTEDAICAAYEALHVKPALADERTTLPDYGNHA